MKTGQNATRFLTRRDVRSLLSMEDCIAAVEDAFRAHALGESIGPQLISAHVEGGAFHIKAAGLSGSHPVYAAKINGNFYSNSERFGLPRIQGLIVLCDARNGVPLAVLDSTEITGIRTAAATAVAAKYLSRLDCESITLCGCGVQGRLHLAAIRCVRPIQTAYLFDTDPQSAQRLADSLADEIKATVVGAADLSRSTRQSDICITCTPSRRPFLGPDDIAEGAFVAAVGADSEEKQELHPQLLRTSKLVVDNLEQCAAIGELHHALSSQALSLPEVHGQLHEVVAGQRPGRTASQETFVFDSTGVALQDVAAAALVYQRAAASNTGTVIELLS